MIDYVYYVYQHRKKDTNEIFYVGKGKNKRYLEESNRNNYWNNIVCKHGFFAEILFENLNEELSLLVEMELIDKYKKLNINLCNLTNGGEGVSGLSHSEKSKKLMSKKALGKKISEETKKKISEYWTGKKRKSFSEEHRKKISEKRKQQKMNVLSEETKKKISLANTGKKRTEEQKLKISESTKLAYKIRMGVVND
jgi:hypothetical protein